MENTGTFKRMKIACTNYDGYYSMLKSGHGTIKYFFCCSIIIGLLAGLIIGVQAFVNMQRTFTFIVENTPEIAYYPGHLIIEEDEPKIIDSEGFKVIFMKDEIYKSSGEKYIDSSDSIMLFTESSLIQYTNGSEESRIEYKTLPEFAFSKQDIIGFTDYIPAFASLIMIAVLIIKFISVILSYLVSALILSVAGLIIVHLVKIKMKFRDVFRTTIYVMTAPTVIYELLYTFVPVKYYTYLQWSFYIASIILLVLVLIKIRDSAKLIREEADNQQFESSEVKAIENDENSVT